MLTVWGSRFVRINVKAQMKLLATLVVCSIAAICMSRPSAAMADATYALDIPAQDLGAALKIFGASVNQQVLYSPDVVTGLRSTEVKGDFTPKAAILILLKGSGLQADRTSSGVLLIRHPQSSHALSSQNGDEPDPGHAGPTDKEVAKGPSGIFRLAQRNQGVVQDSSTVGGDVRSTSGSSENAPGLTEIIVTAQKRGAERLQDVPIPLVAVNAEQLVETNQTSLTDYYNTVPGLSIGAQPSGNYTVLSIRGISTGSGFDPTVGITLDDAPFGGFSNIGTGNDLPDIEPNDLERVEVLRGPQGTLFGSNSMGGLIRFVTKDPTTDSFNGSVTAGASNVQNGAEAGYTFRGSANIPLDSDLAMRISGFTRQDPGYIDDPVHHINGINEDHADGGMLTTKWEPSDSFSLRLQALYQHFYSDGTAAITTGLGDLQQVFPPPGVGGIDRVAQAYGAVVHAKLGDVNLTSVTAYNINRVHTSTDYTYGFGSFTSDPYVALVNTDHTRVFSEEFRFSGSIGSAFDWLGGLFYAYERTESIGAFPSEFSNGEMDATLFGYDTMLAYREYAGFGALTYHITDRFDVQFGARESSVISHKSEVDGGSLAADFDGADPYYVSRPISSANVFTYLVTPEFKVSSNLMVYARVASGYRPGGANGAVFPGATGQPPAQYKTDKITDYDLGVKADLLDHRLTLDASLYYIDWRDIQLSIQPPANSVPYTGNGSGAKSEGFEVSVTVRPLQGLTLATWVDYDDAVLTQTTPSGVYGLPGFKLPFVSRWSGNLSVQQDFPLGREFTGYVGGLVRLVGDRLGEFAASPAAPARQDYPTYTETDLRAGIKYRTWTTNLFANNITNRRGILGGGIGETPPYAFTIIQPRTVGLNVTTTF